MTAGQRDSAHPPALNNTRNAALYTHNLQFIYVHASLCCSNETHLIVGIYNTWHPSDGD